MLITIAPPGLALMRVDERNQTFSGILPRKYPPIPYFGGYHQGRTQFGHLHLVAPMLYQKSCYF